MKTSCLFLLTLLGPVLSAAEVTVKPGTFRIEQRFSATALPTDPVELSLEPLAWQSFEIEELIPHGSRVKQGDLLIGFEAEALERKLEDQRNAVSLAELQVATEELAFAKLRDEVALQLEAARRIKKQADEDLAYFEQTGRPAAEAQVAVRLKSAEFRLQSAKEELAQLKLMYEEDDLTEQTEEIILDRQKVSVEMAEAELKETKRKGKLSLESTLPRKQLSLKHAAESQAVALAKSEKELPRSLKTAELKLAQAKLGLARQQTELERLEKDAALLSLKAPDDGVVYHGRFEDGSWKLADVAKALVKGGKAPLNKTLVTLVKHDDSPSLAARVDTAAARSLNPGSAVRVSLAGHENLSLIGKLQDIHQVPAGDGKHLVSLDLEWPEDLEVAAGTSANCVVVSYEKDDALSLPVNALHPRPDGTWTVKVKLANGKFEERTVEPGRVSGKNREILSGLEAGQVIVVPGTTPAKK